MTFRRISRGLLRLAARTASTAITQPDPQTGAIGVLTFTEQVLTGGRFYLRVTAASGTGGLTLQVRAYDEFGNVTPLGSGGTPVTANGTYIYDVNQMAPALAGNVVGVLPARWDVIVNHADTSSYTYSLTFEGN